MARLYSDNAAATLATGITAVDTSIPLATGMGSLFPNPSGGDYFELTLTQAGSPETSWEKVQVTGRSGDTLTVVRGFAGSTAAAWSAGAKAELRITADILASFASNGGNVDITSLAALTSLNGGQLAGFRNKILNGNFNLFQRGVSVPAAVTGTFTADRFSFITLGTTAVVTMASSASVPNTLSTASLSATVTTADAAVAAGDLVGIQHRIEGFAIRGLIGVPFTLSFWARSSVTGAHCVALRNSGVDKSIVAEYSISTADTWEFKTVTFASGLPTLGTWEYTSGIGLSVFFTMMAGSTYRGATAGTWYAVDSRATANQVNCMATVGNVFGLAQVQLEVGSVATAFELVPPQIERALCERYYQQGSGVYGGDATSAATYYLTTPLRTRMRAAPTGVVTPTLGGGYTSVTMSSSGFDNLVYAIVASATGVLTFNYSYTASAEL